MLKRYMHKRERHLAMLNDDRVVHEFEWGTQFVSDHPNGGDPREFFREYSRNVLANSDDFFFSPDVKDFNLESRLQAPILSEPGTVVTGSTKPSQGPETLTWTSGIETTSPENNTAYAAYFPHETNRKSVVVVLPHWNAKAGTYLDLCKFFNKLGMSSLRLTLPYHEERRPPELHRADYLVAPTVGRT